MIGNAILDANGKATFSFVSPPLAMYSNHAIYGGSTSSLADFHR